MNQRTYRDMHLLNEVTQSPDATQRELSRRIGIALGLTNLMLRRLAKKGYIKIIGTKRSRLRYLITPQGILEKSRLTYEFIHYSLQFYGRIRSFLREQFTRLAKAGHRRILLCGTNELAEIAFLTIHEMGLELGGVVEDVPSREQFLGRPVRPIAEMSASAYDWVVIASLRWGSDGPNHLAALGIPVDRAIILPESGVPHPALHAAALDRMLTSREISTLTPPTSDVLLEPANP